MNVKNYLAIFTILISTTLFSRSMEFNSCKSYVKVEKNLEKGEEFGLLAMEKEPDNAYIPYFMARFIYRPQKMIEKAGEMYLKAINTTDTKLERPFKTGAGKNQIWIKTVHDAVATQGVDWFNYGLEEEKIRNYKLAIKYFKMASMFDPNLKAQCYNAMAFIFFNDNNPDSTFHYINKAIDISSNGDNNELSIELKMNKIGFLSSQKRIDEAFEIYETLPKNELSAIQRTQIFELYKNNNNCDQAIKMGNEIFPVLENDFSTPMSVLSGFAFNMAACYLSNGTIIYNEIIENWAKLGDSNAPPELIESYLLKAEQCKESYSSAKDYFRLSLDYEEGEGEVAKKYKKDVRKKIRDLDNEIISVLEGKLSK